MILSFSIGTFLTNYDVTIRKLNMHLYTPVYKNEQKWGENKSMETTVLINFLAGNNYLDSHYGGGWNLTHNYHLYLILI